MADKNFEKRVELELRKLDIQREKARLVLDKCVWLYFLFMVTGVFGFIYGYIANTVLYTLVILSFFILIIGTLPYTKIVSDEEKKIDSLLQEIK